MDRNNHSNGFSIRSAVDGIARAIVKQKSYTKTLPLFMAAILATSVLVPSVFATPDGDHGHEDKIKICHFAQHPDPHYNLIEVKQHDNYEGHGGHDGDIIPATDANGDGEITVEDCGFVEEPSTGSLTIIKETVGGDDTFGFTGSDPLGVFEITTTQGTGNQVFSELEPGFYTITENSLPEGWEQTGNTCDDNDGGIVVEAGQGVSCVITNTYTPPAQLVTINAYKIVCDNESDLPNWGDGGPDITATTAEDWVAQHETCHFQSGWNFQWGPQSATEPEDSDTHIGSAGEPWVTFGPTDSNGLASVELTEDDITDSPDHLWFREELQEDYIPFTYHTNDNTNADDVSAEVYCSTDVLNYDNYDRIDGVQLGSVYNCVAFNVQIQQGPPEPAGSISGYKFNDQDGDGVWDEGEPGIAGWEITLHDQQYQDYLGNDVTVETDEDGYYSFSGVEYGEYLIFEHSQDGWTQTFPDDPNVYHITLSAEDSDINGRNFGNHHEDTGGGGERCTTGTIDGMVFSDTSRDGIVDEGEEGIVGVTVYLDLDNDNTLSEGDPSTVTDENGFFHFGNLAEGTYIIREVVPNGWELIYPGSNDDGEYEVTVTCEQELSISSFQVMIQAISSGNTNVNFANVVTTSTGGSSGGGGTSGGGGSTPPNNEGVEGEQSSPTPPVPTSNEEVKGEQSLPVTGQSTSGLMFALVLVALGMLHKRTRLEQ